MYSDMRVLENIHCIYCREICLEFIKNDAKPIFAILLTIRKILKKVLF